MTNEMQAAAMARAGELQEVVASGQVSPDQIEAHRAAGELPITMSNETVCGQVSDGIACTWMRDGNERLCPDCKMRKEPTLREMCDAEFGDWVNVPVADLRAALDDLRAALLDAERFQELLCAAWPESMRSMAIAQIDNAITRHKGAQS